MKSERTLPVPAQKTPRGCSPRDAIGLIRRHRSRFPRAYPPGANRPGRLDQRRRRVAARPPRPSIASEAGAGISVSENSETLTDPPLP